ncbi:hypothetical protein BO71DRAFT_489174 [Aspergillus ellipticus CBS 707.79]|uniref:Uncharacterized protein n=1 Tax=Aspergillus ellipticus CBS 707.79 TaxID=1448320 RepID=A0A319CRG5_9EURO|nr:hypothetical protein BO71DRAFT_489174 [Aspergillus ellipticus CBS 707.79]
MKFTEGMWRLREGIRIDWMSNVERFHVEGEKVDLLLNKLQRHRGDTLNSATISAEITSPLEGIVGVKFVHWAGGLNPGPHYELASSSGHVQIDHDGSTLNYTSGPLTLTVPTSPNDLAFSFTSNTTTPKPLTGHSWRSIGYVGDQTTPKSRYEDGLFFERQGHMLLGLDLGVGEKLYGLGERFGPFIKNGQTVDIWNEDGGTSSELAYKNIPFYLSSAGYGVFVNDPGKVSFELQSERTTRVNISIVGEELQYFVIYGSTPKEILDRYTRLTGRPSLVPAWSLGLWLSFTTNYDEQTVTGFLDGFRDRDIPLSVFHFDSFWMKSYQWCDFDFDADMFPDAAGYIARLKARGLRICVWMNPYVGQASPLFKEGKEKGYFIKVWPLPSSINRNLLFQYHQYEPQSFPPNSSLPTHLSQLTPLNSPS